MNLPSVRECFDMIREMQMMDHIIDHSVMVSNVAVSMAGFLQQIRPELNIPLIQSASLLHDITKTRSLKTCESHSDTGGIFLTDRGFPEVGDIVRQHVNLDVWCMDAPVSEPEIVNYADKRVLNDRVVSLAQRLDYIKIRYGGRPEFQKKLPLMWKNVRALEIKLFQNLSFGPEELSKKIRSHVNRQKDFYSPTT